MELKLFSERFDALGKVAGWFKAIVNLPKAERVTMRRTLDETYRLAGAPLNRGREITAPAEPVPRLSCTARGTNSRAWR